MNRLINLSQWKLNKTSSKERTIEISIHLKFPSVKSLLNYTPQERKNKITEDLMRKYNRLLKTNLFKHSNLIGTPQRPTGIKATVAFSALPALEKLPYIRPVFIHKISNAKRIKQKRISHYYCVKMTVAIEIEGVKKGIQTIEERFVLIKAYSFEDAYKKIEKQKDKYVEPYLNSEGQLVRWKIESFDDCYKTDAETIQDFSKPEGIEVYSKLKTRRIKQFK